MAKSRVEIPINPSELIDLSVKIAAVHKAQAAASPLSILKWDEVEPLITEAD